MKNINYTIIKLLTISLLFFACQNDDLPKANFDLNIVKVFAGEVKHEKVSLVWQEPDVNVKPESYILSWSPNGEKVVLDATVTSYEVIGLTNGTDYKFTIQADYGASGISGINEIQLKPIDELKFKVLPGNKFAIALWDIPKRNDISGYSLTWMPGNGKADIAANKKSYQITGLQNDILYTFSFVINYNSGVSKTVQSTATPGEISAYILSDDSPLVDDAIQFTYNPAYLPTSSAASWNYDFGDGTSSTQQNPVHTFTKIGVYEVKVSIKDDQNNVYNDSKKVYVWGEKWSYNLGAAVNPQIPTIASDGTIYIGSEDNNKFHAINPSGTLRWIYTDITDNVYSTASIGDDGTIYVGSKDNFLHAINPNGTQKWKFNLGADAIFSTPAIASDGTIYISSDSDKLFAVNPNGTQKWVFTTAGFDIRSSPAIAKDGTVYIASDDKNLYALNPSNGTSIWSFPLDGVVEGSIALDTDGTVIVTTDKATGQGNVVAVKPDGSQKWNTAIAGRMISSPAIAKGRVYFGTKESKQLVALNAASGSTSWTYTVGDIIVASPTVDKNGAIYFGSFDNNFYVLNPNGTEKYKINLGNRIWSAAAIHSDGTVYFGGYDSKLHAYEFFAEGLSPDAWPTFGKNVKHTARQ